MVKSSEEMKQLVEEFIKVTGINYQDQTDKVKEKSDVVEWQFRVGTNVIVSKNANRSDRIHLNVNMRFTPKDTKLLVVGNPSFSKAIMEISEICTICSVGHQWVKDKESIISRRKCNPPKATSTLRRQWRAGKPVFCKIPSSSHEKRA